MPRTKQRRGRGNNADCDQAIKDFNRLVQLKIHKVEMEHRSLQQKSDMMIEMALNRFPTEIQNMTLRDLVTIPPTPKKENLPPKTPRTVAKSSTQSRLPRSTVKRTTKRTTTTSDDGYQSESLNSQASKLGPPGAKKSRMSRPRSSSQSRDRGLLRSNSQDRQSKLAITNTAQKKNQKDMLKTPQTKPTNTFVITPKIKFNSAVNVLRKPKDGEMVFSTQGSPLLVSTTVNDRTANVNVPLQNGKIVSLLPFNDTSLTENLVLDEETRDQLKILQSHLAKVLD